MDRLRNAHIKDNNHKLNWTKTIQLVGKYTKTGERKRAKQVYKARIQT